MEVFGFEFSVTWLLIGSLVVTFAWYDWWCHQYFQRRGIPVDSYTPFFGHILQWRHGVQVTFTDYVKKFGKIVGMYDFRRPVLIIADADILKNVLVKNFANFHNRRELPLVQKPLNRGVVSLQDESWKEIRTVITPSFSASKMRLMGATINECCDGLVKNFGKAQEDDKAADCKKLYGGFTMDAIARCGFGLNVDSQENEDDPFVKNARKAFDFNLFNPAFMLASAFPSLNSTLVDLKFGTFDPKVTKFFTDVTETACRIRRQEGEKASKHIDLLQLMLNAHNDTEHEGETSNQANKGGAVQRRALSTDDVMAQALTFFLAGYETTNTLLCFASYLLATNQDVQEKLHAEIDDLAPNRDNLGYDTIAKMDYLDMVVNETLRMYPPAVIFDRMCNETITYDGLTIEKGVNVMVSLWTLHYDEDYWTNPTRFDPERFSAENKDSIIPCSFMPFGFGPRNCIGMRFALLESKMALVRAFQQYRFDVCSETVIPPVLGKMGFLTPESLKLRTFTRK